MKRVSIALLMFTVSCSSLTKPSLIPETAALNNKAIKKAERIFVDVVLQIHERYYEDVDLEAWTLQTLDQGLQNLDRHATLSIKSEARNLIKRDFRVRVGITFMVSEVGVFITEVAPGTPAWHAGLALNDKILSINDIPVLKKTLKELSGLFDAHNPVTLTIAREGEKERTVRLQKDFIQDEPPYESKMLGRLIGYIYLANFQPALTVIFPSLLSTIAKADALIIDLRSNSGGQITTTVDTLSYFFKPKTPLATARNKTSKYLEYMSAGKRLALLSTPIVVLVNHETASGAELFTQVLQEYGRALVIGEQTAGLGTVVFTYDSFEENVGINIPEYIYFGPSGRSINKIGITPTLTVRETNPAKRYVPGASDAILETALRYISRGTFQYATSTSP